MFVLYSALVSMDIKTPNIDTSKIVDNRPIAELDKTLIESLVEHGIDPEEAKSMAYSEFRAKEVKWQLTDEMIKIAKNFYPELADVDMDNWTYGQHETYFIRADKNNLAKRFSNSQLKELKNRGIRVEDTFYLFKEFHDVDTILSQPDKVLRDTIEGYYHSLC